MKQPQHQPLSVAEQVAVIFAGVKGYLDDVPVNQIIHFERDLLVHLHEAHGSLLARINETGQLPDEDEQALAEAISGFGATFKAA